MEPRTSKFGRPKNIDSLLYVIGVLCPKHIKSRHFVISQSQRLIEIDAASDLTVTQIQMAVRALKSPEASEFIDAEAIVALLEEIRKYKYNGSDMEVVKNSIKEYTRKFWDELNNDLSIFAIKSHKIFLLTDFPELIYCDSLMEGIIKEVSAPTSHEFILEKIFEYVGPRNINDARQLIAALDERRHQGGRNSNNLSMALFASVGRALEWDSWSTLQAIVRCQLTYAQPHATFPRHDEHDFVHPAPPWHVLELARNIQPQADIREVAALLLEIVAPDVRSRDSNLFRRPAEVRAAYVDSLKNAVTGDNGLRQAAMEVLLWSPVDHQMADLAQFAATALAEQSDRDFLITLKSHPVRGVRYASRAILAARFGDHLDVQPLSAASTLLQSLASLEGGSVETEEPPKTWIGDRSVERLIEQAVSRVEAQFGREYTDHGDEGEDRLLSSLFTNLAIRFRDLDHALAAVARASSAPYRASVSLQYRNVDRHEEGKEGIKGVKRFSADLCLIIDPILNGTPLGRRVTLVQAKRLYRARYTRPEPTWDNSFRLDAEQVQNLLKQTGSSVYFFHGPTTGGRGVPVIPTRLVSDLSRAQGAGSSLARNIVATSSRSLADWLTYDLIALRIGDSYPDLVERAEGRQGSLPRRLLDLPTVELTIALQPRSGDG